METCLDGFIWQQMLEHSLQSGNYQPILDQYVKAQSPVVREKLLLKTAEFAANMAKTPSRSNNIFYSQKVLLFLHLCQKAPSSIDKIETFCKSFSSAPGFLTALREAADVCLYIGKDFLLAEHLYQQVLDASASGPEGIWAQRGLVMTAVENRDFSLANARTKSLLENYSQHPQIASAVRAAADRYFYANDAATAGRLYAWLAERPDSDESIWVLRGLAMANLHLAEYAVADAALEQLQKEYSGHPQYDLAIRETADEYFYWGHDPRKAQFLYRQILQNCPEGPESIWAQKGLILTAIELGELARAREELKTLLAKYEEHPQIAAAVRIAADHFFYFGNDPHLACTLYERILQDWPDSSEAMAARRGLAMVNTQLAHSVASNESAEKLLTDFSGQPELEEKTAEMLQEYCRAGRANDVIALSEKILLQKPSQPMRLTAYTGLARACIQMNQQEQAAEVLRLLLTAFPQEKLLGKSLFGIGEEYYWQGQRFWAEGEVQKGREALNLAVEIWEMIPKYSVDSQSPAHALYYTAAAHRQLGDNEKALEEYRQVLLKWPAYEKAWFAQFQIACCCEDLFQANKVSKETVRSAYQKVIEKYPFCPAVRLAAEKLKDMEIPLLKEEQEDSEH